MHVRYELIGVFMSRERKTLQKLKIQSSGQNLKHTNANHMRIVRFDMCQSDSIVGCFMNLHKISIVATFHHVIQINLCRLSNGIYHLHKCARTLKHWTNLLFLSLSLSVTDM